MDGKEFGYYLYGTDANSNYTRENSVTSSMRNGIYQLTAGNMVFLGGPNYGSSDSLFATYGSSSCLNGLGVTGSWGIRPLVAIPWGKFTYTLSD